MRQGYCRFYCGALHAFFHNIKGSDVRVFLANRTIHYSVSLHVIMNCLRESINIHVWVGWLYALRGVWDVLYTCYSTHLRVLCIYSIASSLNGN